MVSPTNKISIPTTCPKCGRRKYIVVKAEDFHRWQAGELIQRAFSYLSDEDREALITGLCGDCWKKLFSEEEEN